MANDLTPREKFNNILIDVNKDVTDILSGNKGTAGEKRGARTDVFKAPTCGVLGRQAKYKTSDEMIGNARIDQIVGEIKNDKVKWGHLEQISPENFNTGGSGAGSDSGRIEIKEIIYPRWLDEIETNAKLFFKRSKSRQYYDEESLSRGLPKRQKVKKNVRAKSLYVLLDTSGSMWYYQYKGVPMIELMVSYFPHIARKFEGELWQIDVQVNLVIPLKNLKSKDLKDMPIGGGGGTDYDIPFQMLRDKKSMLELSGKPVEFMTILFTDLGVKWNKELMPDNLLVVAPADLEKFLPELDASRGQKAILIDVSK